MVDDGLKMYELLIFLLRMSNCLTLPHYNTHRSVLYQLFSQPKPIPHDQTQPVIHNHLFHMAILA